MSAILSADDLNDFINPGVACIKPVETLPKQQPLDSSNPYEVTTEDKVNSGTLAPPAQISLTDCLACSGCVTSAEAVLVSLQSHGEVLDTLDKFKELKVSGVRDQAASSVQLYGESERTEDKLFVASVSPQSRASIAATYNVSEREAGHMISQLLSGPSGVRAGGRHRSGFAWVLDTNAMREASLVAAADEVEQSHDAAVEGKEEAQKRPIITSACPGWICYAEKTHPHILPHLSRLKSPQALTGVLIKSVLAKHYGIPPEKVWHLAVMPCFDKKLEASRSELTSHLWHGEDGDAIRDVDCVITARELLMLAESRNISFPALPRSSLASEYASPFPEPIINDYLFGGVRGRKRKREAEAEVGTSGGYLWHILKTKQAQHPGSQIKSQRGRNSDVSEFSVVDADGQDVFRAARYYGFRNIQNLVRRLKPPKPSRMPGATRKPGIVRKPNRAATTGGGKESEYAYVEVMACPGGCTNGGGQIKVGDVATLRQVGGTGIENGGDQEILPAQRDWLAKVDEAYWSAEPDDLPELDAEGDVDMDHSPARDSVMSRTGEESRDVVDGIDTRRVKRFLDHWSRTTGVDLDLLLHTTYRIVESDVGKNGGSAGDVERVSALAHAAGGGW